ncbi:MAG: hypothetical protein JSU65_09365 [Candidatus Zixiibacteriota bacterium]|nr:MAG: hypothetical protein JSU65_09365 [candidate division Zixibacteria bacterium]
MDFVSHALWGGVTFGRKNKRGFSVAAGVSIMPDVLTEGLFMVLYLLDIGGMPGWESGHPNITDFPMYARTLYNMTHSLIIFVVVFMLLGFVARRPIWVVAAWGLHILIDIPTHSLALFPTPFLWPVSDFRVDGIGWDNPMILAIDIILLLVAYSLWLGFRLHRKRQAS